MNTKYQNAVAPVLTMQSDLRIGMSNGGWSLFRTPAGFIYFGCSEPADWEYMVPLRKDTLDDLGNLIDKWDPAKFDGASYDMLSILEQCHTDAEELERSDEEDEEDVQLTPEVLDLSPVRDHIWGGGDSTIGMKSEQGIYYFLHGEHLILVDALPFRMACSLLSEGVYAKIKTDSSFLERPCLYVEQEDLRICFHLAHPKNGVQDTNDGRIHATPLQLAGTYRGQKYQLNLQG